MASHEQKGFESHLTSFLCYLLILHVIAIYSFTRGFLLTRVELDIRSSCTDLDSASDKCWSELAFEKTIILFIDAARFDFVVNTSQYSAGAGEWQGRLRSIARLAEERRDRSALFRFIADPPTTSLQRLKGLTTGGLPTFVDVGSSFTSSAIQEDNIISQLKRNGRRTEMLGDDTWLDLFPDKFSQSKPFPSLVVKDIHSVDDGIMQHLPGRLLSDDWDVLIAHFLGVDHVGHTFSVDSTTMLQKLDQMDAMIQEVVAILQSQSMAASNSSKKTLLLVMGDHAQTISGDHGGGTPEETDTFLFATSFGPTPGGRVPGAIRSSPCDVGPGDVEPEGICIGDLPQIDFAPTVSALLGIPIPFASLGRINPEIWALSPDTWHSPSGQTSNLTFLEGYEKVLRINSWQVRRYLHLYSESTLCPFSADSLAKLDALYSNLDSGLEAPVSQAEKFDFLVDRIRAHHAYLALAADVARSQWTQFGLASMFCGAALLVLSVTVHVLAIWKVGKSSSADGLVRFSIQRTAAVFFSVGAGTFIGLLLASLVSSSVGRIEIGSALKSGADVWALFAGSVASVLAQIIRREEKNQRLEPHATDEKIIPAVEVAPKRHRLKKKSVDVISNVLPEDQSISTPSELFLLTDIESVAAIAAVTLHGLSLTSNSFIMAEGHVARYLMASLAVVHMRRGLQEGSGAWKGFVLLILNASLAAIGSWDVHKRSDDLRSSTVSVDSDPVLSLLAHVTWTYLPLVVLGMLLRSFFPYSKAADRAGTFFVTSFGAQASFGIVALLWAFSDYYESQPGNDALRQVSIMVPRYVYISSALLLLTAVITAGRSIRTAAMAATRKVSVSPEMRVRAALVAIWASLIGPAVLLLGRNGPIIALLAALEGGILISLQLARSRQQPWTVHPSAAIEWSLMAVHLYFCTGHRCSFDGLHYSAAFTGFEDFNYYRQGALLAFDTFGMSHAMPVLLLPVLATFHERENPEESRNAFLRQLQLLCLTFGATRAFTTTVTALFVALEKRHLMVWSLFAPKYVFDVVGLVIVDVFLLISASFSMRTYDTAHRRIGIDKKIK